jgi:predicted kinase
MSNEPTHDDALATHPTRTEDQATIRDAGAAVQPKNARSPRRSGKIHVIVGPVGAGKSTYGFGLAAGGAAVRLTLDEWMTALFRPDRPEANVIQWYVERASRCVERIWAVARDVAATGTDVVLEVGMLRRRDREQLYARAAEADLALTVHALDAPRDVRRERVERRNREQGPTFSMIVPPEFFERASDLWEPLEPDECQGRDVRFVTT